MNHDTFIAWQIERSEAANRNLNWDKVKDPQPGDKERSLNLASCSYPEYVAIQGKRKEAGEAPVQREVSKSEQREEQRWQRERVAREKDDWAAEIAADKAKAQAMEVEEAAKAEVEKRLAVEAAAGQHGRNEKKGREEQKQERERLRWEEKQAMIRPGIFVWAKVTGKQEADYGEQVRGTINGWCEEERVYTIRFDDGRMQAGGHSGEASEATKEGGGRG
jgi:hypothetical protein